jgi:hypothetical protein
MGSNGVDSSWLQHLVGGDDPDSPATEITGYVISSSTALLCMKFRNPICENNGYLEEFKLKVIFLSSQSLHINTSPSRIHFIN